MKGYEDKGSSEYLSRQPGFRTKTVRASYDITTSSDIYRIALQFCSIDTTDQGNLGCNSLYITKLGNSDMAYSYWGNWEWEPGIVIEYDSE